MTDNPHFLSVASWHEAESHLPFAPVVLHDTEDFALKSMSIFVRDHKHRDVPIADRSLEAHFEDFVFTQALQVDGRARSSVIDVSYGQSAREALIGGREARIYDLGAPPEPGDIDPRMPAVVVWHENDMFFLLASDTRPVENLMEIAASIYRDRGQAPRDSHRSGAAGSDASP